VEQEQRAKGMLSLDVSHPPPPSFCPALSLVAPRCTAASWSTR